MKVSSSFLLIVLYFFFNSVFLPAGLTYTLILTPFFYLWLVRKKETNVLGSFLLFSLPYVCAHLYNGVELFYYARSYVMVFGVYVFTYAAYIFLKNTNIQHYFQRILVINLVLFLIATIAFFTKWKDIFWFTSDLTKTIKSVSRLRLLTYEPSYYSLVLVPVVIYYFQKTLLLSISRSLLLFVIISLIVPLVVSFSFGVLSCLLLAVIITVLYYRKPLLRKAKIFYAVTAISTLSAFVLLSLLILFPDNTIFTRLHDVFSGNDTSASGRTFEAFILATRITNQISSFFGVGFGQVKLVGHAIIVDYYNYVGKDAELVRIPNATAETIATLGFSGFTLRLFFQIYLFVKTKVYTNIYRFTIFFFIFIYQFTGSFLPNPAECILWVLAFTPCFEELNINNFKTNNTS